MWEHIMWEIFMQQSMLHSGQAGKKVIKKGIKLLNALNDFVSDWNQLPLNISLSGTWKGFCLSLKGKVKGYEDLISLVLNLHITYSTCIHLQDVSSTFPVIYCSYNSIFSDFFQIACACIFLPDNHFNVPMCQKITECLTANCGAN